MCAVKCAAYLSISQPMVLHVRLCAQHHITDATANKSRKALSFVWRHICNELSIFRGAHTTTHFMQHLLVRSYLQGASFAGLVVPSWLLVF